MIFMHGSHGVVKKWALEKFDQATVTESRLLKVSEISLSSKTATAIFEKFVLFKPQKCQETKQNRMDFFLGFLKIIASSRKRK